IKKELFNATISRIEIEQAAANQVSVTIYTAKPGIVIGKSGEKVDKLRATLERETKKRVRLNILEIRQPELDAYLVARSIAEQLEKRISFRRAMKQAVQKAMKSGAKGVKIIIGGRLGGAEIARSEKEVEGQIRHLASPVSDPHVLKVNDRRANVLHVSHVLKVSVHQEHRASEQSGHHASRASEPHVDNTLRQLSQPGRQRRLQAQRLLSLH